MNIIEINAIQIKIDDEGITSMKEYIRMNTKQEILIRNKRDTIKLSKQTLHSLEDSRRQRFEQAIRDDDMLYLNNLFNNASILDLVKMLIYKNKRYI